MARIDISWQNVAIISLIVFGILIATKSFPNPVTNFLRSGL